MRNIIIIIFSFMMLFSSSCAMKKAVMRYLDVQQAIPAKALPSVNNSSEVSTQALCSIKSKTGRALDDVDLAPVLNDIQLKAPVFFLLIAFLFSWIALYLIPLSVPVYFRQHIPSFSSVPLYLKLRQLVYYA